MTAAVQQAQTFGDIRIEGQGNQLVVNQVVQISAREVLSRTFLPASPYRGLEAFDDKHSHLFFGRDALIAKLLKAVPQHPLLMVSGASGSGKSSVVRAGLLPQLAQRVQGFRAFKMTPGSDPFAALKYGLVNGQLKENKVGFAATAHPDTLVKLAALRPKGECWLLCVDQFEEMFTLCDGAEKRSAFFAGLLSLGAACPLEFRVVLTMRSDFFDRFDAYPELLEQVRRGLLFVTSPDASELRQCIEQPAAQHGVVFEDGLVSRILSELQGRPGTLPLLQYTLNLLWHEDKPANDKTLNTSSYLAIQGVQGALRQRADTVYAFRDDAPRSPDEQQLMRRIFLRLVEVSGQEDAAPTVSRRRPLAQFSEAEQSIVRELVEEKLLISNLDEADAQARAFEQATVELVHESLISAWPTLAVWLKEARQVLFIRGRLSHDAAEWQRLRPPNPGDSGRADEELWSGSRLSTALEMRARGDFQTVLGRLSDEEESFLKASEAFVTERLRREREATEKIRQLLLDSYIDRGHQLLFKENDPYRAALWLHRAYQEGSKNPSLPHLLKSAMLPIDTTRVVFSGHRGSVVSASFSPEGGRIVTASRDGTARVWDAGNGRLLAELKGHGGSVESASFSPEGGFIVTASRDGTARVWDAEDGWLLAELKGHGGDVVNASFNSEGGRIVTASLDGTARVWDAGDGRLLAELKGHGGSVESASFSPVGGRIVTVSLDGTARVWDAGNGRLLAELKGHGSSVWSASFSPEGGRIVTASGDRTARVWDARDGRLLAELKGHGSDVGSASFSPEGGRIVTASGDGTARLWDAEDGRLLAELKGHGDAVVSASFSSEGGRIVTASVDGMARLWDAGDGRLLAELKGHVSEVRSASFSPEDGRIVTASGDGTARVWDAGDGRLLAELKGHGGSVRSASFSPEGGRIVTASRDGTARVWDAEDGWLLAELKGHGDAVVGASFSPEGGRIVTASGDETARVWDAEDGRLLAELKGHGDAVVSASFSPEGGRIVTASVDGMVRIWDAGDGRLLAELKGHVSEVRSASFSPEGGRIVTASGDGTARLWDAGDGRLLAELKGHGNSVWIASFSPEGGRIVAASGDGTARVWDAEDGRILAELKGHESSVWSASFSPEGGRIVTASGDETARVWDARDGRLLAELKGHGDAVVSASFSPEGGRIVTASGDGTARLWDAGDGRLLAELKGHGGDVVSASFSPEGKRIVTASGNGTARVWDVGSETRAPEQLAQVIRSRSCVRFDSEASNVIVRCTPPAAD